MKSISMSTGNGLVEGLEFSSNSTFIPAFNELSINLKVKTSKVFDDQKEEDEDQDDFEKKMFKWHCEFGIPENLEKLRREFNLYRNLKPVKVMITGPPASGKTFIAERLSKFYNLPHIKIHDIIEMGKELQDELGEEVRYKIEELKDKMVEEWEEAQKKIKNRKKNEPHIDRNTLNPRLPDEIVVKLLRRKLNENLCKNRGYILDGYPRSFIDAQHCFVDIDESKPEEDPTKQTILDEILPNSLIRLQGATDEFLKNRIKLMPDYNLVGSHYTEEGMTRRINLYKTLNESIKGDLSLSDFFLKRKVDILALDCKFTEQELMNKSKIFLERNGPIINYQIFDEEEQKSHKNSFEQKLEQDLTKLHKEMLE
jgi:adenylate kinase